MKELELKHIVGYLPYGLEFIYNTDLIKSENKWLLVSLGKRENGNDFFAKSTRKDYKNQINTSIGLIKPILRPLSDLKKDEYFDLYMDLCEEMESISCEYLLESLINKTKYAFNLNQLEALDNWMYKNHFDWKYNLIENNLAIDINTL